MCVTVEVFGIDRKQSWCSEDLRHEIMVICIMALFNVSSWWIIAQLQCSAQACSRIYPCRLQLYNLVTISFTCHLQLINLALLISFQAVKSYLHIYDVRPLSVNPATYFRISLE